MYIYQRDTKQLKTWHNQARLIWEADNESLDGRKAFELMDRCAQELEGRGYTYNCDTNEWQSRVPSSWRVQTYA